MEIIIVILGILTAFFGFNWLMGYKKGYIVFDLDNRYIHLKDYVEAVKQELIRQGRDATYEGNRILLIDEKHYVLVERNVSMGGVPLQHTVLKPFKNKKM